MTDRQAFEAWWIPLSDGLEVELEKTAAGAYLNVHTAIAWSGWKASRKQMAEEAAAVCQRERDEFLGKSASNNGRESDFAFGSVNSAERIEAAIRSLATPTEGKT